MWSFDPLLYLPIMNVQSLEPLLHFVNVHAIKGLWKLHANHLLHFPACLPREESDMCRLLPARVERCLTHWPLGNWNEILGKSFKNWLMAEVSLVILPSDECYWTLVMIINIGSGNGVVPSGTKPLPEPMLTRSVHLMASLGHNELTIHLLNCLEEMQLCVAFHSISPH